MILLAISLAVSVATAEEAPRKRVLMLPIKLPASPSEQLVLATPGIERALTDAVARQAGLDVIGRAEIAAMLGKTIQDQLTGCDTESCATELADSLGADDVVVSRLDEPDGLWSLQASLVDRRSGAARGRAAVRARNLDALISAVDQVARQIAGGAEVSLRDPTLARRLGTDEDGMAALRNRVAERPDGDVTQAWTDVVISRNRESGMLALLEGGAFAAASAVFLLTLPLAAMPAGIFAGAFHMLNANPDEPILWRLEGPVLFPVVPALLMTTGPLFAIVPALLVLAAGGVVSVVDALNPGRVAVTRGGCCRDEARIRDAEEPSVPQRIAPFLAAFGGVVLVGGVILYPLALPPGFLPAVVIALVVHAVLGANAWGPTLPLSGENPEQDAFALQETGFLTTSALALTPMLGLFLVAIAGTVGLILTERSQLLDDDAEINAPAAAATSPPLPRQTPANPAAAAK